MKLHTKKIIAICFPFFVVIGVILANLGLIALAVWVVVNVLKAMGVL